MLKTLLNLIFCLFLSLARPSQAAEQSLVDREYQLKTAYLLHFAELAEWPDAKPVTICLLGNSPLRAYLSVLEGREVRDQTLHVRLLDTDGVDGCKILFLGGASGLSKSLLTQAQSQHILLVGDYEGFARNGGMIQFALKNNKLKLTVNLASVKQAGLRLSSKLLRMAEILE